MSDQQLPQTLPPEPPTSGAAPEAPAPTGITRQDLDEALNTLRQEMGSNYRGVQARQDGFEARVKANIQSTNTFVEKLKSMGITLDANQAERLKQSAWQDALEVQQPQTQAQQPPQQQGELDPITRMAYEMLEEAGLDIEESDPAWGEISKAETPAKYLMGISQFIQSKQAQLANPTNPAARLPNLTAGKPAGNPLANITDPGELWRLANKPK